MLTITEDELPFLYIYVTDDVCQSEFFFFFHILHRFIVFDDAKLRTKKRKNP